MVVGEDLDCCSVSEIYHFEVKSIDFVLGNLGIIFHSFFFVFPLNAHLMLFDEPTNWPSFFQLFPSIVSLLREDVWLIENKTGMFFWEKLSVYDLTLFIF